MSYWHWLHSGRSFLIQLSPASGDAGLPGAQGPAGEKGTKGSTGEMIN